MTQATFDSDWNEFSWAVGFWEGEGSVEIQNRTPRSSANLALCAAQKASEDLYRLERAFCCGNVYGPYQAATWMYYWRVSGERAWSLACDMFPYLSTRRREQVLGKMDEIRQLRTYLPDYMLELVA